MTLDTNYWLRLSTTEPARCPSCGGFAEAASFDVLRGEVTLKCAAYFDCGWRSADADRDEPPVGPGLFDGEAA